MVDFNKQWREAIRREAIQREGKGQVSPPPKGEWIFEGVRGADGSIMLRLVYKD